MFKFVNKVSLVVIYLFLIHTSNAQKYISNHILCTPTFSVTNISICSSQLPFKWNGSTYTAPGKYNDTLINAAGCDSIATLNLIVSYPITSTTNVTICPNQLPYEWNGNSYTAPGLYSVNLKNSLGCDSVAELNLTVKNNTSSTTNISVCAFQLPYIWNGNNYNAAGTYKVTLTNSAGCDSIATLNLSVKSTSKSTTNVSVCATQIPYKWNGNSYDASGTYNVTLINSQGCDSVATLNLNVKDTSTSTTNISICSSQLPYVWNGKSLNAPVTYTVTLVNAQGCDSIATLNLTVLAALSTVFNITICPGQLPYKWNGNTYTSAGTYNTKFKSAGGCDSIVTLNLYVSNTITSSTFVTVCPKQLPFVWNDNNYTASGSYTFSLTSTGGCDSVATLYLSVQDTLRSHSPISVCSTQLPYSFHGKLYTATGNYYDTLVNQAGCDSISWLDLTVINTTASTTNVSICTNQAPYTWNGTAYNTSGTYKLTLVNSRGCDSVATLNLLIGDTVKSVTNISVCQNALPYTWNNNSYNTQGTYSINLISSSGCDSLATLNLMVNNTTTSSTSITICPNNLPYLWNGNTYAKAGSYNVRLTGAKGCDSIATLNLIVRNTTTFTTITICPNLLPFSWNGNRYNAAGTYNVTLPGSSGCDSTATLNLIVNSSTTSNTKVAVCSNQLPYVWNGENYTATGIYNVTLTNAAGCDSVATLTLTVSDTTTSISNVKVCSNQLPYVWNGKTYNAAGTYKTQLTNAAGCDSIATLNLTVNNATSGITNVNVCINQLPFVWNGFSYITSGTYSIHLTNAAGCDSLATLNLTVSNISSSTTGINICSNQLPYSWNGNNYTAPGTYTARFINAAGCDSLATLNLSVSDTATSITNVKVCSNQLPYVWNGTNYNTAGTYKAKFINMAGCDSTATLNLLINNATGSVTDVHVCSNQLPYAWNGINYTTPGTYIAQLTNATGCDSTATLNLTVSDTIFSVADVNVCSNQLPYLWNGVSYTTSGTYSIHLTNVAGCDSTVTLNLHVSNVTASITNIRVCLNKLPYIWNGNKYTLPGTYNVHLVNVAGCDSAATLNLFLSDATSSITNVNICPNQLPYAWNGNKYDAAGSYKVQLANAAGCDSIATLNLSVSDTLTSITAVNICSSQLPFLWNGNSYNTSGTYKIVLTNAAGCDSIAELNLKVSNSTGSITSVIVCPNQLPFVWNGNSYTASGNYTVNLINAAGCDSVATLQLTVPAGPLIQTTQLNGCGSITFRGIVYNSSAAIRDTVKNSNGCDSIYSITNITIYPADFNLSLSASPSYLYGGGMVTLTTSANLSHNIIAWQPALLFTAQNALTQHFIADSSLQVSAIAKSNTGCIDSATLYLDVHQVNAVYVPSGFTPNGDGNNDLFRPMVYGRTTAYNFVVYNRWGKKVFESSTPGTGWDGLVNAQPQAQGTYVWTLSYTLDNGVSKTEKGSVVLIR